MAWGYHMKGTVWFKRSEIAQNTNSNELSKNRKRISENCTAEADKRSINLRSTKNRLTLFSSQEVRVNFETSPWEIPPWQNPWPFQKNTSIQRVLLIQLLLNNLNVTFQNLFMSCKISQITFPWITKYQPLMGFRNYSPIKIKES